HKDPSGAFVVRGRARPKLKIAALLLTGDEIVRPKVAPLAKDGVFSVSLHFAEASALDVLEVLAESDRGPEVAALWRFEGNASPPPRTESATNDAAGLRALVDRVRADRDLAPLESSTALERAARQHADTVCRSMIAAHVMPDGSSPLDRAKKAGWRGAVT